MRAGTIDGAELNLRLQALVGTESPSDVFHSLLHASALAVSSAAVFLIRQGEIRGWGSEGYDEKAAAAQKRHAEPFDVRQLAESTGSPELTIDFGQPAALESVWFALRIRRKPIALVLVERSPDAEPWSPDVVSLLVRIAESRLELDLVLRKLGAGSLAPEATAKPTPIPVEFQPEPEPAGETAELAPVEEGEQQPDPALEPARRYARLLATDIRLYNEEAVALGQRHGDLLQRLGDQLGRGRETFCKRHGDLGAAGIELLHQAYVQVLADGDASLIPPVVLE